MMRIPLRLSGDAARRLILFLGMIILSWAAVGPFAEGTERTAHPKWVSITAGKGHGLAVKSDGTLWAWGGNGVGQLGDGTTIERHSPVQVGKDNDLSFVVAGYFHTVALKSDGSLWTWGLNEYGQLGDGTTEERHSPVQIGRLN